MTTTDYSLLAASAATILTVAAYWLSTVIRN